MPDYEWNSLTGEVARWARNFNQYQPTARLADGCPVLTPVESKLVTCIDANSATGGATIQQLCERSGLNETSIPVYISRIRRKCNLSLSQLHKTRRGNYKLSNCVLFWRIRRRNR